MKVCYNIVMKKFVIHSKEQGKKLNTVVQARYPELSFGAFQKALRKKDVRINQKRVHENCVLQAGDEVCIYLPDSCFEKKFPYVFADLVIYEDANILLLYKPAGIEVQGENSFTTWIQSNYPSSSFLPEPCHRLDRNTSGILLYAKNQESLTILLDCFKNHEIEKHYHALVFGIPKYKKRTLTSYLFKDSKKAMVFISDVPKKGYQKIITSYQVLQENANNQTSLLDVTLETGRTHQIRAHLAHIGHPIVGDGKYGNAKWNKQFSYPYQQLVSYSLQFHFKEKKPLLQYLNEKKFTIKKDDAI